jgi:hypothetical protein
MLILLSFVGGLGGCLFRLCRSQTLYLKGSRRLTLDLANGAVEGMPDGSNTGRRRRKHAMQREARLIAPPRLKAPIGAFPPPTPPFFDTTPLWGMPCFHTMLPKLGIPPLLYKKHTFKVGCGYSPLKYYELCHPHLVKGGGKVGDNQPSSPGSRSAGRAASSASSSCLRAINSSRDLGRRQQRGRASSSLSQPRRFRHLATFI